MKRVLFAIAVLIFGGSSGITASAPPSDSLKASPALNQMEGTIQSLDSDNRLIRLQTEDGFNVEFAYDHETVCKGIGVQTRVSDLAYKDHVIIRYAGKEMVAREIEKRSLQPAMAASTPTLPAN